jgi:hypothetical protein
LKLKAKRVSHSFWLNLATKARSYFKIDQPLINYRNNQGSLPRYPLLTPPKFAIANNFAIGLLPDNLSFKITEITSPMLSPVRPYAYVLSYCGGGAHKAFSGSFSFFNQSPENLMGSLKFHSSITKTNKVYV